MYLTVSNLSHYLMSRGLISPESLVDGDLVIVESGRRNRNFKVIRRNSPGLFIKQIGKSDPQSFQTMQREAQFYARLDIDSKLSAVAAMTPKLIDFDPSRYVLTITLTTGGESLAMYQMRKQDYSEENARLVGKALAVFHTHASTMTPDTLGSLFPLQVPWIMTMDQNGDSVLKQFGPIGEQLAAGISAFPNMSGQLAALRSEWQFDSLIHGDMKWENCLLCPPNDATASTLQVVDWELVDIGDSAWDLGTIMKEYLVAAIFAMLAPQAPGTSTGSSAAALDRLRPSIQAFWEAYKLHRGLAAVNSAALLLRSVRFTAARMVVAVLEYLHGVSQFTNVAWSMLQTCWSILQGPQRFSREILGLAE